MKSDGSTCEGEVPGMEEVGDDVSSSNGPIDVQEPLSLSLFNPQVFFWVVQGCKNIFQLYLGSSKSTSEVSSQLIIEVSNKEELKRLLSLLACEAFQA